MKEDAELVFAARHWHEDLVMRRLAQQSAIRLSVTCVLWLFASESRRSSRSMPAAVIILSTRRLCNRPVAIHNGKRTFRVYPALRFAGTC